jgi:hypothetical protein
MQKKNAKPRARPAGVAAATSALLLAAHAAALATATLTP